MSVCQGLCPQFVLLPFSINQLYIRSGGTCHASPWYLRKCRRSSYWPNPSTAIAFHLERDAMWTLAQVLKAGEDFGWSLDCTTWFCSFCPEGPHFAAVNKNNEIIVTDFHNHSVKVRSHWLNITFIYVSLVPDEQLDSQFLAQWPFSFSVMVRFSPQRESWCWNLVLMVRGMDSSTLPLA